MCPEPTFDVLMERLRRGDQRAAQQIFQRFAQRLIGLARSRLEPAMRGKVDPEDVMASVFKSFFLRHAEGQFEFDDWDGLWSLLTVITLRKCGHKVEHYRAACRDVLREVPLVGPQDESGIAWEAVAREPAPSEAIMLTETLEQVLRGLDGSDREIVELGLQGYKASEISVRLGRAERSVYRLLERVKKRLQRLCTEDLAHS